MLTPPGVRTVVAIEDGDVVGFAYVQTDGATQAHLSLVAVMPEHRRRGIGLALVRRAFAESSALRIDLVTDTADAF